MQLAIPWPNPDDLRKEEVWQFRRLEMFRCSQLLSQGGQVTSQLRGFFWSKKLVAFFPENSTRH